MNTSPEQDKHIKKLLEDQDAQYVDLEQGIMDTLHSTSTMSDKLHEYRRKLKLSLTITNVLIACLVLGLVLGGLGVNIGRIFMGDYTLIFAVIAAFLFFVQYMIRSAANQSLGMK